MRFVHDPLADRGGYRRRRLPRPGQKRPARPIGGAGRHRRPTPAGAAATLHPRRPRALAATLRPRPRAGPARDPGLRAGQRRSHAVWRWREPLAPTVGRRTAGAAGALLLFPGRCPPGLAPAGGRVAVGGGTAPGRGGAPPASRRAPAGLEQRRSQPRRPGRPAGGPGLWRQPAAGAGAPGRSAGATHRRPRRDLVAGRGGGAQPGGHRGPERDR